MSEQQSYDVYDICKLAGRDPNEQITTFVLADLLWEYSGGGLNQEELDAVVDTVRHLNLSKVADALCEASGWQEIFECWFDMELDKMKKEASNGTIC